MHALGHALLALAAGMCAKGIASPALGMDDGSTAPSWAHALAHPLAGDVQTNAFFWGILGATAAAAKLGGGTIASYLQSRVAGDIAADVRLDLLDRWLAGDADGHPHQRNVPAETREVRRSRQSDQGHALDARGPRSSHPPNHDSEDESSRGADSAGAPASTLAAMIAEVRDVQIGIERGLLASARALLQLVPLVLVLVLLAPGVALGALFVLAPFAVLLSAMRRRWKRGHRAAAAEAARLLEAADDAVRHADLWTTFGAEAKARAHVARLGRLVAKRGARLEAAAAAMSGANELLAALLLLAILGMRSAGWLTMNPAQLLPFVITFFLAYRPLRELAEARIAWSRAEAAYASFAVAFTPLRMDEPSFGQRDIVEKPWPLATLALEGVTSALPGRGIAPLSLTIAPGEIVSLSGRTGAGKTSLFRALLGLDAMAGHLLYGDASLDDAAPGPIARPFAWVPQDAPLVAASLAVNVTLGADDADAAAVLADLGAAHLTRDFGDDRLGAGGRPISGGERQWVALARAVATRQPVLLLDEPTSGLDAAAQASVLAAISRLRGKRTVILVTHRPEPSAIADRVIRLESAADLPADATDAETRG